MASMRFVLPWPFAPTSTIGPGSNATSALAQLRKSATDKCRRYMTSARQAHGHDQVVVLVVGLGRPEHGRLVRRREQQPGCGCVEHAQTVQQEGGVERDRDRLSLESDLELFLG